MTLADSIVRVASQSDSLSTIQLIDPHSLDESFAHRHATRRQRMDHFYRLRLHSDPMKRVADFLTNARLFPVAFFHSAPL